MTARIATACLVALLAAGTAVAQDDVPADPAAEAAAEPATDDGTAEAAKAQQEIDDAEEYAQESAWQRELLTMEQDTNTHKDKVMNAKSTLQLLRALVIEGASLGSRVAVWHVDKLGTSFEVLSVSYFVNGDPVFHSDGYASKEDQQVHEQTLPPGQHAMRVDLTLRGRNKVFSYIEAYTFKLQSDYAFQVKEGKLTTLRVITHERGPLVKWEKRPRIKYDERHENLRGF